MATESSATCPTTLRPGHATPALFLLLGGGPEASTIGYLSAAQNAFLMLAMEPQHDYFDHPLPPRRHLTSHYSSLSGLVSELES